MDTRQFLCFWPLKTAARDRDGDYITNRKLLDMMEIFIMLIFIVMMVS